MSDLKQLDHTPDASHHPEPLPGPASDPSTSKTTPLDATPQSQSQSNPSNVKTHKFQITSEPSADSNDGRRSGAPFPMELIVAHSWDIGVKFYQHIKFLIDWINKRLEDPEETGEDFMRPGGSGMMFHTIWLDFFLRMVETESSGIIERLQYGLKVRKDAHRVHQCLHFQYGQVIRVFPCLNTGDSI